MADSAFPRPNPDQELALAIVATATFPLLLLDGGFRIVAASKSFCESFDTDHARSLGTEVLRLGDGGWNVPQLRSLLSATAERGEPIYAYEMEFMVDGREPRSLILNARRLDYGYGKPLRLLLRVTDVTNARVDETATNDLLQEKGILLQEMQHRIANSLQIIASVLLESARRVQSQETRSHLCDASNRVMSVAALQRELATSAVAEVELRAYFNRLCASIGASMIHDPTQILLEVTGDSSKVKPDVSVSLGLMVTELAINALKHAFPAGRRGRIRVDYRSSGTGWILCVEDDGVGLPENLNRAKAGLGTSIVEALARRLGARIDVTNNYPGTTVCIGRSTDPSVVPHGHHAI